MAHARLNNQAENFWNFTPTCSMEDPGPCNPLFPGCNSHDHNVTNDSDCQWPGFSFNGPFPHKPYVYPSNNQREPESGEDGIAREPESKTSQNSNDPRTMPFIQAPPFFEHPNRWAGGCEGYQNSGGRAFYPGQRGQYGFGSMNWFGPWGNFRPSMGFGPWGGFGPWSNFGHWGGLPFWGNPRFTRAFAPPNTTGPWGRFGSINCFGNNTEPEFNVFETPVSFVVCISLFNANKAGLKVELDSRNCEVGIRGTIQQRGDSSLLKGLDHNSNCEFEHKLCLGNRVNRTQIQVDGITARMEDGILVVCIPKVNSEHANIKTVQIE